MGLIVRALPELPLWADFRGAAEFFEPAVFGFENDWPLIHRFHARYVLAKVCGGLKTGWPISAYRAATAQGYDALTRALVGWSMFELYVKVLGIARSDAAVAELLDRQGAQRLLDGFRAVDGYERFFGAVEENARRKYRASVRSFLERRACDAGLVLGAVRHIFAHGFLTPNARGIEPEGTARICNDLADFLIQCVEADWTHRVEAGIADLHT